MQALGDQIRLTLNRKGQFLTRCPCECKNDGSRHAPYIRLRCKRLNCYPTAKAANGRDEFTNGDIATPISRILTRFLLHNS